MPKVTATIARKADHIRINLEEDVQFHGLTNGLERWRFVHQAVPELDLAAVDTGLQLMGRRLAAPLLISSMTGGTEAAGTINRRLAEGAQARRIAMGLGSMRAALEDPAAAASFRVREAAPDILLFANLGAVQLNYGYGPEHCRRAVALVGADALFLHLNALQEAVQPEGDTNFAGLAAKIEAVCRELGKDGIPVVAKEVGWGISPEAARTLAQTGVAAIDVAGSGGTSWSQVEKHRAPNESHARVAAAFRDWGIPTADAIINVRLAAPDLTIFASGGLRSGVEVAKCLALGARLGGMASPYLKAAAVSTEAVVEAIDEISRQLRIAMFAAGAADLARLQSTPLQRE